MSPDGILFNFIHSLPGNPAVDQLMIFFAEFLVLAVPAALVYLWYQGKAGRIDSLYVFIAVTVALIASYAVLGQAIQHESPFQVYNTIASGEPENSFPSQHTATLLAMVLPLLWRKRKNFAYFFLGTGLLTGFSRIYIGEHYPVDILGSAIAAIIGFAAVILIEKYMDSYVEALANLGHKVERKISRPFRKIPV
ncbi:phosphatase PAP2 family protein [Candidatus Nanosalina sp. VS9-1]|uniref:phosphatase PAP2 family protein n=1 Tax=Candidatus Nanosalina sp. VS9-1 TaxID=3388566 RepID=UPI0039E0B280